MPRALPRRPRESPQLPAAPHLRWEVRTSFPDGPWSWRVGTRPGLRQRGGFGCGCPVGGQSRCFSRGSRLPLGPVGIFFPRVLKGRRGGSAALEPWRRKGHRLLWLNYPNTDRSIRPGGCERAGFVQPENSGGAGQTKAGADAGLFHGPAEKDGLGTKPGGAKWQAAGGSCFSHGATGRRGEGPPELPCRLALPGSVKTRAPWPEPTCPRPSIQRARGPSRGGLTNTKRPPPGPHCRHTPPLWPQGGPAHHDRGGPGLTMPRGQGLHSPQCRQCLQPSPAAALRAEWQPRELSSRALSSLHGLVSGPRSAVQE